MGRKILMIEFINVSKKYAHQVTGLNDVNLKIEEGEFVFVIGPSGAGKSTFLKMINRQEKASQGQVIVNGVELTKMPRYRIPKLRREVGVVFQDFKLLEKKTVYQNVAFALEVLGLSAKEVRQKTVEALRMVGLEEKLRSYPNQLSGGEQQRVAIARAIANNPKIIVADEPTGNLDPETSEQILAILKRLNKEGKTIVMATHDHELIFDQGCRVLTVNHGTICKDEERGVVNVELETENRGDVNEDH